MSPHQGAEITLNSILLFKNSSKYLQYWLRVCLALTGKQPEKSKKILLGCLIHVNVQINSDTDFMLADYLICKHQLLIPLEILYTITYSFKKILSILGPQQQKNSVRGITIIITHGSTQQQALPIWPQKRTDLLQIMLFQG